MATQSDGASVRRARGDKTSDYRLAHWPVSPDIDANVDHPAPLTPLVMNVTVPVAVIGRAVFAEAIVIMAVASVREVRGAHRPCADPEPNSP